MTLKKEKKYLTFYVSVLARYGIGIVFFIFGIDQLVRPKHGLHGHPSL